MKILYISHSIIPSRQANSIQVMKMCAAFAENGHDVTLFAPAPWSAQRGVADVFKFYGVEQTFRLRYVWVPDLSLLRYVYGAMVGAIAIRLKPDLVYGRSLPGCLAAAAAGFPVIYESHVPESHEGPINALLLRKLLQHRRLARHVVISQALKEHYEAEYAPAAPIVVAHDGADPATHEGQAQSDMATGPHAGYIGHLRPGKGMELIQQLATRLPSWTFHVVGGNDRDIEFWKRRTRDVRNITYHGFLSPAEAQSVRGAMDVLLAPYQENVYVYGKVDLSPWMSPLKIFEYMAAEKPIVCSDLPVLREILTHEETALLCPPADVEAWAEALTRLQSDSALAKRVAHRAKYRLQNEFTWWRRANVVLDGLAE